MAHTFSLQPFLSNSEIVSYQPIDHRYNSHLFVCPVNFVNWPRFFSKGNQRGENNTQGLNQLDVEQAQLQLKYDEGINFKGRKRGEVVNERNDLREKLGKNIRKGLAETVAVYQILTRPARRFHGPRLFAIRCKPQDSCINFVVIR